MLTLAFPGSFLESIWRLKPEARVQFKEIGSGASIALMATVGMACGLAAVGLARRTEWGRRLAIGILAANLVGDSLNALLRHDPKTLIGLPIGALMIWYLVKKKTQRKNSIEITTKIGRRIGSANFQIYSMSWWRYMRVFGDCFHEQIWGVADVSQRAKKSGA